MNKTPTTLIIMDGFGLSDDTVGNAAELLAQPDIDGGLIGGASLKPADFVEIINAANQD